ncbi:MAG: ATP-binding protein [Selenomonas ruminantium]|uniref:ATP-binding protein n=1 Tax=Selenomonas ruminantium TaxID=971 RepID=A0A927ZT88_SELRU|nr:ATP-binding protein [Selenomonas ruminantium]
MIKREYYMKQIRPFIGKDIVKVLTGMRRCGKSVMMELLQAELKTGGIRPEQILSLNFEDLSNADLCNAVSLNNWVQEQAKEIDGKVYLFLDEIQEVQGWEKVVNSLRVSMDIDIYVTGSNAKILSGELSTYLAGRYVQFVIYPFSYREFLLGQVADDSGKMFQKYLLMGGMPFLLTLDYQTEAARVYLKDAYNSVLLKDIVQRNKLRDTDLLERIIRYALSSVGQTFSASSIVKFLKSEQRKVSNDTVLNYLNACTAAYLFYKIPRQDVQGKKILAVNEKYYIADHGIREAVYGRNVKDIQQVLENIVCMELLRRGYKVTVGKAGTQEIDFIAERAAEKIYVQVTYLLAGEETIQREFGVYRHVQDNFPKYVVSMDELDFSQNGIKHMNVREFLLSDSW